MKRKNLWNLRDRETKQNVLRNSVNTRERVRAIKRQNVKYNEMAKNWVIVKVK